MYGCIYGALIIEQAEMKIIYFYCQSDIDSLEEISQNPVSNSLIIHKTFFQSLSVLRFLSLCFEEW